MKVPKPRKMSSGNYYIQMRLGGEYVNVTEASEKACRHEAERIKAEWLSRKRLEQYPRPSDRTLKQACQSYIDSSKGRLSPSTIQGYQKIIVNSFSGLLSMKLCDITLSVVQKSIDDECKRKGRNGTRSPKSVNNDYNFLAQILRENGVDIPRPRLPELRPLPVQILTADQVYGAVKGTEIELPCLLAMWMTLTISEIRGLTKSKSIRNGQLSIVETVVDIDGKPVRKSGGKEVSRARTLPIPAYISDLIDKVDGDIICPLSSQATNKRLQRLLEKIGLPQISFHKLRHIAASTMTELNIPPAYIKAKGGWKTEHIMNTVYVHTFTEAQKAADMVVDNYMQSVIENAK